MMMKKFLMWVLGAALLAGCGTMQSGGFGKPSQLRCSCGLALGHAGAHAGYTIGDFMKAKQQLDNARGN